MAAHQYKASLYATPPSGGVRFVFFRYTHGFRSLCSLHTVAILCRLAMRRGSQIPLASLARQISIYLLHIIVEGVS